MGMSVWCCQVRSSTVADPQDGEPAQTDEAVHVFLASFSCVLVLLSSEEGRPHSLRFFLTSGTFRCA